MDVLEDKARKAVDTVYTEKTIRAYLKDQYNIKSRNEVLFFMEFLKGGSAYKAYKKVYAPTMQDCVARSLSSRLMKKYKVSFEDWLEYAGHGTDSINEALNELKDNDADKYLKHVTTLKQLDVKRIEHSGAFTIKFEEDLDD